MCVSTRANNISNYKHGETVVINNARVLTLLLDYTSVNPCKSYKILSLICFVRMDFTEKKCIKDEVREVKGPFEEKNHHR